MRGSDENAREGKAQEEQTQEKNAQNEKVKFDPEKFRRRLRMVLAYKDMQQKELADKAGISVKRIGSYAQGIAQPPLSAVVAIANALEVSLDYLTGRTDKIDGFTLEESNGEDEELLSTIRLIRRAYKDSTERERRIILQLAKALADENRQKAQESGQGE